MLIITKFIGIDIIKNYCLDSRRNYLINFYLDCGPIQNPYLIKSYLMKFNFP